LESPSDDGVTGGRSGSEEERMRGDRKRERNALRLRLSRPCLPRKLAPLPQPLQSFPIGDLPGRHLLLEVGVVASGCQPLWWHEKVDGSHSVLETVCGIHLRRSPVPFGFTWPGSGVAWTGSCLALLLVASVYLVATFSQKNATGSHAFSRGVVRRGVPPLPVVYCAQRRGMCEAHRRIEYKN
jgi:hypothetical protein